MHPKKWKWAQNVLWSSTHVLNCKFDFRFSENFSYNKGLGCLAKYKCPEKVACKLGTENIVTSDFKAIGYCTKSHNGCAVERKYGNRNCEIAGGWQTYFKRWGASYDENCSIAEGQFRRYLESGESYTIPAISARAECAADYKSYTITCKDFKLNTDK